MLKSSRAKNNAQPHWNIRLAILLLIEHVEIKGLQGFCNETHFAMKHLCPNKSCIFCFCFLFPQGFCYFWEKDQKTSRKPTKTQKQTIKQQVWQVFFLPRFSRFFATFGRGQKESLRTYMAVFDRYLHLFVSEMLAFRDFCHPISLQSSFMMFYVFSVLEQLDAVKVKEVSNGMADWSAE